MALLEICEVSISPLDSESLHGRSIDWPKVGQVVDARAVDIDGWVLGSGRPIVGVELIHNGTVLRRAGLTMHRPDVGAAFPDIAGASNTGFRISARLIGKEKPRFEIHAISMDGRRIPIAVIEGTRRWRESTSAAENPLVAVIIPGSEKESAAAAIESVLGQSHPHYEIVLVEDGSTESVGDIVGKHPIVRPVQLESRGPAAWRNTGIRRSLGDYLVFVGAGELLHPKALEIGIGELREHPACAYAAGLDGVTTMPPVHPASMEARCAEYDNYGTLLRGSRVPAAAAVMYRRAVFEVAGVFDSTYDACPDYEMCLRVAREHPTRFHEAVVAELRTPQTQAAGDGALLLITVLRALRSHWKHVKRHRQYRPAYEAGMQYWRGLYTRRVRQDLRARLSERNWGAACDQAFVLASSWLNGRAAAFALKRQRRRAPRRGAFDT
jgi:glycosyltransferase involved in cell wall biosynthesis